MRVWRHFCATFQFADFFGAATLLSYVTCLSISTHAQPFNLRILLWTDKWLRAVTLWMTLQTSWQPNNDDWLVLHRTRRVALSMSDNKFKADLVRQLFAGSVWDTGTWAPYFFFAAAPCQFILHFLYKWLITWFDCFRNTSTSHVLNFTRLKTEN